MRLCCLFVVVVVVFTKICKIDQIRLFAKCCADLIAALFYAVGRDKRHMSCFVFLIVIYEQRKLT